VKAVVRIIVSLSILGLASCFGNGAAGNAHESSSSASESEGSEGDDPTGRDSGTSMTLRVRVEEAFRDDIVHIAGLFLEMEVVEVGEDDDAHVVLHRWDEPAPGFEDYSGYTVCDTEDCCRSRVWSLNSSLLLAHELGHALGLQHVDDPQNLMSPHVKSGIITDEQFLAMRRHAWKLEHDCE
jgi:hypothetical protein